MRKEYINPELSVIDIKLNGVLLSGSTTVPTGGSGSANDAEAPGMGYVPEDE